MSDMPGPETVATIPNEVMPSAETVAVIRREAIEAASVDYVKVYESAVPPGYRAFAGLAVSYALEAYAAETKKLLEGFVRVRSREP